MTKDGVVDAPRSEAARTRAAARTVQKRPVELAPTPPVKGTWTTPITRDPLDVPIEEKVALLLAANEAALKVPKDPLRQLGPAAAARGEDARDDRRHARHADVRSRRARRSRATAIGDGDFQSYNEELAPRGSGWEYIAVARHAGQRREVGVARRREADGASRWTWAATT